MLMCVGQEGEEGSGGIGGTVAYQQGRAQLTRLDSFRLVCLFLFPVCRFVYFLFLFASLAVIKTKLMFISRKIKKFFWGQVLQRRNSGCTFVCGQGATVWADSFLAKLLSLSLSLSLFSHIISNLFSTFSCAVTKQIATVPQQQQQRLQVL